MSDPFSEAAKNAKPKWRALLDETNVLFQVLTAGGLPVPSDRFDIFAEELQRLRDDEFRAACSEPPAWMLTPEWARGRFKIKTA